jgi:hypothetical protein
VEEEEEAAGEVNNGVVSDGTSEGVEIDELICR